MNIAQQFIDDLDEMVSYRRNVTGIDHTLFISPRGNARHGPRLKVAIDPPDSLDPRTRTASVSISLEPVVVSGMIRGKLLQQVNHFILLNRDVLLDYWDYRIDTDQLRNRLKVTRTTGTVTAPRGGRG